MKLTTPSKDVKPHCDTCNTDFWYQGDNKYFFALVDDSGETIAHVCSSGCAKAHS